MIDPGSDVSLSMLSLATVLKPCFADLGGMAPQPLSSYLGRAFSTCSTMCYGCFPSAATGRPNVFGKTSASPRPRAKQRLISKGGGAAAAPAAAAAVVVADEELPYEDEDAQQ